MYSEPGSTKDVPGKLTGLASECTTTGLSSRGNGGMSSKFCPNSCNKSTHIKILYIKISCKEDEKAMNLKRKTLTTRGGQVAEYSSTLCGTTLTPFRIF